MTIDTSLSSLRAIRSDLYTAIKATGSHMHATTPFEAYGSQIQEISTRLADPNIWTRPTDWLDVPSLKSNETFLLFPIFETTVNMLDFRIYVDDGPGSGNNYVSVNFGDGSESVVYRLTHKTIYVYKLYEYANPAFDGTTTAAGYKQAAIVISFFIDAGLTVKFSNAQALYAEQVYNPPLVPYPVPILDSPILELISNFKLTDVDIRTQMLQSCVLNLHNSYCTFDIGSHSLKNLTILGEVSAESNNARLTLNTNQLQSLCVPVGIQVEGLYESSINRVIMKDSVGRATINQGFSKIEHVRLASNTNFNSAQYCETLKSLDLSTSATILTSMFSNMHSLSEIEIGSRPISSLTFSRCYSLRHVTFNTGSFNPDIAISMSGTFNECRSLQVVKFPNSPMRISSIGSMFSNCNNLVSVEFSPGSLAQVTSATSVFLNCRSLHTLINFGPSISCSISNCNLSFEALNRVYTDLPTVVGQTITVTGNPGTSQVGHDPSIATAKGWTVTV
jgi:hypothetical protein